MTGLDCEEVSPLVRIERVQRTNVGPALFILASIADSTESSEYLFPIVSLLVCSVDCRVQVSDWKCALTLAAWI